MDQRVRPRVTLLLGQIQPHVTPGDRYEKGKATLALVLPLLRGPQPRVPRDSPRHVLDTESRYDLLVDETC
jgi:hypothetical protein